MIERTSSITVDWNQYFAEDSLASLSEKHIQEQVEGLSRMLALKSRSRILDLGCGTGRQTIELARRGHRVLGIDSSLAQLAGARATARGLGLNVHFLGADPSRIPYTDEFDAIVNLHTPIGSWQDEDDLRCLASVHKALKPHGKLLLDLLNREWLIRRIDSEACENKQGLSLDIKTGRIKCLPSAQGARSRSWVKSLRLYALTEIVERLSRASLTFQKVWGGFDGAAYGVDSLRMIVLAEKLPQTKRLRSDDLPRALRIKGRPR